MEINQSKMPHKWRPQDRLDCLELFNGLILFKPIIFICQVIRLRTSQSRRDVGRLMKNPAASSGGSEERDEDYPNEVAPDNCYQDSSTGFASGELGRIVALSM